MPDWIDTHTHLDDARFDPDRAAVLTRLRAAGVVRAFVIGVDLATSRAVLALAESEPDLFAVVGIQPNYAAEMGSGDFAEIERLAEHPRVVAIGETGLDRYWDRAPFERQLTLFEAHLALARRVNKPVVIHCRDAGPDVATLLEAAAATHGPVRGVMHSFSADASTATRCLAAGLHLSFAGMLTYKNAQDLRDIAKSVPADRLLVETDCPYLAPVPQRGKRNEPAFVAHTWRVLAETRGESVEAIAATTTRNARELFGV